MPVVDQEQRMSLVSVNKFQLVDWFLSTVVDKQLASFVDQQMWAPVSWGLDKRRF